MNHFSIYNHIFKHPSTGYIIQELTELISNSDINEVIDGLYCPDEDCSCDIDQKVKTSLLEIACDFDNFEVIDFLLENKADININNSGALFVCRDKTREFLISRGISLTTEKPSLFYCNDIEEAKSLIEQKADVNLKGYYGYTPLDTCKKTPEMFKFLIDNKAEPTLKNFMRCKDFELLKIMINANVNYKDSEGKNLLFHYQDDMEVIKFLVEAKIDVNSRDNDGNILLHKCGDETIAKLLIEAKANVNMKNNWGYTPLHKNGKNPKMVKVLIEHKAEVNAQNKWGQTLLHLRKSVEVIKLLIEAKASFDIKNNEGDPPYILENHSVQLLHEGIKLRLNEDVSKSLVVEFFKRNMFYILECIFNYDNDEEIQRIMHRQLN